MDTTRVRAFLGGAWKGWVLCMWDSRIEGKFLEDPAMYDEGLIFKSSFLWTVEEVLMFLKRGYFHVKSTCSSLFIFVWLNWFSELEAAWGFV